MLITAVIILYHYTICILSIYHRPGGVVDCISCIAFIYSKIDWGVLFQTVLQRLVIFLTMNPSNHYCDFCPYNTNVHHEDCISYISNPVKHHQFAYPIFFGEKRPCRQVDTFTRMVRM